MRSPRSRRSWLRGLAWSLPILALVLLWRAGHLPGWVYEGRLRNEVLRRTGFDLADRTALDGPRVEVRDVRGVPGPVPAVVAEFENVGSKPIADYHAVAAFRSGTREGPRSAVTYVAGGGLPPLQPGERRQVRLASRTPYDPKTITGRPARIDADLYWGGSFNPDGMRRLPRRSNRDPDPVERVLRADLAAPDRSDIVVRP